MKKVKISQKNFEAIKDVLHPEHGHSAHIIITEITKNIIPELFKVIEDKIPLNIWYKSSIHDKMMLRPTGIDENGRLYGSGVSSMGNWVEDFDKTGVACLCNSYNAKHLIKATDKEVFKALQKVAVQKGFIKGAKFNYPKQGEIGVRKVEGIFRYQKDLERFETRSYILMEHGKWIAEVIKNPTYTKAEAEKKFSIQISD